MSSIIHVLSEQTINQIAAGEVIENPASAVKELAENSVDAKAENIVVEVHGGGFARICVSDDGTGMGKRDAVLCLDRYATSKIREADDLFSLKTMGFRGEALASIASISKTTITTSLENGIGVCIEVEGGKQTKIEPAPRKKGTTIDVRSLFYNVPARKKFQKSASQSFLEISKVLTQLSLAYPSKSFRLLDQDKEVFHYLGSEALRGKVSQVLGEEFFSSMLEVKMETSSYKVEGFISKPSLTRLNRKEQYLFINKRAVVSPLISASVKEGYGTYIEEKRYPVFVLHLSVPEEFLDVNVHPQKKEVRFGEEEKIRELIKSVIRGALQPKDTPSYSFNPSSAPISYGEVQEYSFKFQETPLEEKELPSFLLEELPTVVGMYKHFLLIDKEKEILFVDLKLARARVLFDAYLKKQSQFSTERLLFPLTLKFSLKEAECLALRLEEIDKLGIEMHAIGQGGFIVDTLPSFLEENEVARFLEEISEMEEQTFLNIEAIAKLKVKFACPHKKSFMVQEGLALYQELMKSSDPYLSPEGAPIMIHLGEHEIHKFYLQKKN